MLSKLVSRTACRDRAAEPCCAGCAPEPSRASAAGVWGEAVGGYGFTMLSSGLLMAHELSMLSCCCLCLFSAPWSIPDLPVQARSISRAAHVALLVVRLHHSPCSFRHEELLHREAGWARDTVTPGASRIPGTQWAAPRHCQQSPGLASAVCRYLALLVCWQDVAAALGPRLSLVLLSPAAPLDAADQGQSSPEHLFPPQAMPRVVLLEKSCSALGGHNCRGNNYPEALFPSGLFAYSCRVCFSLCLQTANSTR